MSILPISETDLQAYVDSALPEARRGEIEEYLGEQPEEAGRIQAYLDQKQAIKALFGPVLDEPVPEKLRALAYRPRTAEVEPAKTFMPRWSMQRMAASVLIALASGIAGWFAHGQNPPAETVAAVRPLPQQAAVAHVVFSPDVKRPVEVSAEHEDQLVAWVSKRLGAPLRPPKLGRLGYDLVGGRVLPGNAGPVAQFMYQDSTGRKLTLYVSTEYTNNQETAFRFSQEGAVNVFYWIDGKFGYALSASIEKEELARVSSAVYAQIEHK